MVDVFWTQPSMLPKCAINEPEKTLRSSFDSQSSKYSSAKKDAVQSLWTI